MYDRTNPWHFALRWLQEAVYSDKIAPLPPVHGSSLAAYMIQDRWPTTNPKQITRMQRSPAFAAMLAWLQTLQGNAEAIHILDSWRLKSIGMFGVKRATQTDFPSDIRVGRAILAFAQEPRNELGHKQFAEGSPMYAVAVLPDGSIVTANEPYGDGLLNRWPATAK